MRILITNDDGFAAPGLVALAQAVEQHHEVLIVAPHTQRSACAHSLTMHSPLVLQRHNPPGIKSPAYSLTGTPVDCVKVAVDRIYKGEKPDLVLSGVNKGANLGTDVLYSGTVAAAMEGGVLGISGLAVSLGNFENAEELDYTAAVEAAMQILNKPIFDAPRVLNLNIPNVPKEQMKGIVECPLGNIHYHDEYEDIMHEGSPALALKIGKWLVKHNEPGTDVFYHFENYITLTQLHRDLTDYDAPKVL